MRTERLHMWMGALLLTGLVALAGCDPVGTNEPVEQQVVVEAYLMAGEPLPSVRLARTTALDAPAARPAITDATVAVQRLGPEGQIRFTQPYAPRDDTSGFYRPVPTTPFGPPRVEPLATYRLRITTAAGQLVTATTTVPDTFSVVQANADTVVYQRDPQLRLTLTPSRSPGRDQSFYLFTTEALEVSEANLTPLLQEIYDGSDGDASLDDFRITTSPIINEASYDENPDGTLSVRLPWLAVAFYGRNRTIIQAIDDNIYDFVRTQSSQQQGGGFSLGTLPNVIEHVEGGTGLFGSLARRGYTVFVARPDAGARRMASGR